MKDLKKKLKAAVLTVLIFAGIFALLYTISFYAKEAMLVLICVMSIAFVYTVWKLIYQEIRDEE